MPHHLGVRFSLQLYCGKAWNPLLPLSFRYYNQYYIKRFVIFKLQKQKQDFSERTECLAR